MQSIRCIQPSLLALSKCAISTRNHKNNILRYKSRTAPFNRYNTSVNRPNVVCISARHMSEAPAAEEPEKSTAMFSEILYGPTTEIRTFGVNSRVTSHGSRPFYRDDAGLVFTYSDLAFYAHGIGLRIKNRFNPDLDLLKSASKNRPRIAFLIPSSFDYAVTMLACWDAECIAVPLHVDHPVEELSYILQDSGSVCCVFHSSQAEKIAELQALLPTVEFMEIGGYTPIDMYVPEHIGVIHGDERISAPRVRTFESIYKADHTITKDVHPSLVDDTLLHQPNMLASALFIYTSGTTGKPKGVSITHGNLTSQVIAMTETWQWKSTDHIVNVLPMHHVHGVVNVLLTCLWNGARMTSFKFNAEKLWDSICGNVNYKKSTRVPSWLLTNYSPPQPLLPVVKPDAYTLFMAVPTIYAKMLQEFHDKPEKKRLRSLAMSQFRLMVSGSMALPRTVLEQWEEATGHVLLERYGMTEIGMALTNPLVDERVPGSVGMPLPGVEARIMYNNKEEFENTTRDGESPWSMAPGELLIRGPNVFELYHNKPEATEDTFITIDDDTPYKVRSKGKNRYAINEKWFKTGDVAAVDDEGYVHLLGRQSVDVLKVSGYKISALDVERELLEHHQISEVAVVGIPSEIYGQTIAAVVVLRDPDSKLELKDLRDWCKNKMADYKIPRALWVCKQIPRNAMGKINKKHLVTTIPSEILKACK